MAVAKEEHAVAVAHEPFQFATASYLVRIGTHKCDTLVQLGKGIQNCSDSSIFYHTFQSLGRHHFLTEGFSNDFAQWVYTGCNRPMLAERLASLDIRDYVSLAELRADLRRLVSEYCAEYPGEAAQTAFEPFYFNEAIEERVPLPRQARTLLEFRDSLQHLGHGSMQYHFINSRLRLHLTTNDFSVWLAKELGLKELGQRLDQIDMYTNSLDSARDMIVQFLDKELASNDNATTNSAAHRN